MEVATAIVVVFRFIMKPTRERSPILLLLATVAWTLGVCACQWNDWVTPTTPWSGATATLNTRTLRLLMVPKKGVPPHSWMACKSNFCAMQEPVPD